MPKLRFSGAWARQLLLDRIGDRAPDVGAVVTDLQTGEKAAVNPDEPFRAASVAKIPVGMTVLNLVTEGKLRLDDQVIYNAETDYKAGAGSLRFTLEDGDPVSIGHLVDRLIVVSDNVAWRMLERHIGPDTITAYLRTLGVQRPYVAEVPVFTAGEINTLLIRLDAGQAGISPELTRFLIDLMGSTVFRDRIPAKLPPGAYTANKVGTLENFVHDAGFVYAPQRSFAITVFTRNIPHDAAVELIADLSAIMYWYEDWLVRAGGEA